MVLFSSFVIFFLRIFDLFDLVGCGKTELCKQFQEQGFEVLDEGFLDMPKFQLPPQTLTMESIWVSQWISRLLKKQKLDKQSSEEKIYIADRSPFSAVFYAKNNGQLLEPLIQEQRKELASLAGIHIYTVYLKVFRL